MVRPTSLPGSWGHSGLQRAGPPGAAPRGGQGRGDPVAAPLFGGWNPAPALFGLFASFVVQKLLPGPWVVRTERLWSINRCVCACVRVCVCSWGAEARAPMCAGGLQVTVSLSAPAHRRFWKPPPPSFSTPGSF